MSGLGVLALRVFLLRPPHSGARWRTTAALLPLSGVRPCAPTSLSCPLVLFSLSCRFYPLWLPLISEALIRYRRYHLTPAVRRGCMRPCSLFKLPVRSRFSPEPAPSHPTCSQIFGRSSLGRLLLCVFSCIARTTSCEGLLSPGCSSFPATTVPSSLSLCFAVWSLLSYVGFRVLPCLAPCRFGSLGSFFLSCPPRVLLSKPAPTGCPCLVRGRPPDRRFPECLVHGISPIALAFFRLPPALWIGVRSLFPPLDILRHTVPLFASSARLRLHLVVPPPPPFNPCPRRCARRCQLLVLPGASHSLPLRFLAPLPLCPALPVSLSGRLVIACRLCRPSPCWRSRPFGTPFVESMIFW